MARRESLMGATDFIARRNSRASSRLRAGSASLAVCAAFAVVGKGAAGWGSVLAEEAAALRRRFRSAKPLVASPLRPPLFARILQPSLCIQGGHAALAGAGNGLAVNVIFHVAAGDRES